MVAAGDRLPLEQLLQHPRLWRGRSATVAAVLPTGFPLLDEALPGGGWPRSGLVEVLAPRQGMGALQLWLPALATLTAAAEARWSAFIAPPFDLFAPALSVAGVRLDRLLLVRRGALEWSVETALQSGGCDAVLAWAPALLPAALRRFALAAEQGRALGVLFRPAEAGEQASPAVLRIGLQASPAGLRLQFLKRRGGGAPVLELPWPA
ncbi:MAG: hypothetical protein RL026_407 [Pseudomonadota bacterium]